MFHTSALCAAAVHPQWQHTEQTLGASGVLQLLHSRALCKASSPPGLLGQEAECCSSTVLGAWVLGAHVLHSLQGAPAAKWGKGAAGTQKPSCIAKTS